MNKLIKYKGLIFFLAILSIKFSVADTLDTNKKRIEQINREVEQNKQKINTNNTKINTAKKSEASIQAEIKKLNADIKKLQSEYNVLEKQYTELLKIIGKNEQEIKASIKQIQSSNAEIKVNKDEYSRKIKNFDIIRKANTIKTNYDTDNSSRDKLTHDTKVILDLQVDKIKGIEKFKKGVEKNKAKVEEIKQKNQIEANKINKARIDLEQKKKEVNVAKAKKDKAVAELKALQSNLNKENKTIEDKNRKLINERSRLEAQIQSIIKQSSNNNKTKTNIPVVKGTGVLAYPIRGSIVLRYGEEKVQGLKSKGIEIQGTLGQSVSAADTGVVIYSGSLSGLGKVVIINHDSLVTVYGNLASVRVNKNDVVKKGQSIGTLGKDSESKKAILYFEVRKGVNIVNPLNYL